VLFGLASGCIRKGVAAAVLACLETLNLLTPLSLGIVVIVLQSCHAAFPAAFGAKGLQLCWHLRYVCWRRYCAELGVVCAVKLWFAHRPSLHMHPAFGTAAAAAFVRFALLGCHGMGLVCLLCLDHARCHT
jgi:hypothetical protein